MDGFDIAKPTFSHHYLKKLFENGKVKLIITQNVDNLHIDAGVPSEAVINIHGNLFVERCSNEDCKKEYFRTEDVGGMGRKPTGNKCETCGEALLDNVVDWSTHLDSDEQERCEKECEKADLIITLGTSLRMMPVGEWPKLAKKFVIVNLQETPLDEEACLVVHERIDKVFEQLQTHLNL